MIMRATADELALRIMLSDAPARGRAQQLAALRAQAQRSIGTGHPECPECGGTTIEDNGACGSQLTFRCDGCGHQWDAEEG